MAKQIHRTRESLASTAGATPRVVATDEEACEAGVWFSSSLSGLRRLAREEGNTGGSLDLGENSFRIFFTQNDVVLTNKNDVVLLIKIPLF